MLYFQPQEYPHLFEENARPVNQYGILTAPLVLSDELEKKGGISVPLAFSGIYNEEELENYFQSLQESLNTTSALSKRPFALSLSNHNHNITIGCDGKQWMYIDANHMPTKYLPVENVKEIAEKVRTAFSANINQSVSLSTKVYVANDNKEELAPVFAAWQNQPQTRIIYERVYVLNGWDSATRRVLW